MKIVDKKKVFAGWDSMDGLIKASTWGDPAAQCRLGELYLYGFNATRIDYPEAAKWFRLAADQGFARAKGKLGLMNEFGQGMPVDEKRAAALYKEAADQNDGCGLLCLGHFYEYGKVGLTKDKNKAAAWFEKACLKLNGLAFREENAVAQNLLGFMYSCGCGVEQDDEQALAMYRLAAQQGHAQAECNLGRMYNNGDGVDFDPDAAFYWFNRSAKQGHRGGFYGLAGLYADGWGAEEDAKRAVAMWRTAAELGESRSQLMLGLSYLAGENDLPVDHEQAAYWLAQAAERGESLAQRELGLMYIRGQGVPVNESAGAYWLQKAIENHYFCMDKPACSPAPPKDAPLALETYSNLIGMDFIKIPAGTFMMGSADDDGESHHHEHPQREVTISPFIWRKRR